MTKILFLCTGNSARSLIAEGILRHYGKPDYEAVSAGSQPTGRPNPAAIAVMAAKGIDTSFARSKSWDEFAEPQDSPLDIIITVCGNAAEETCPIWPGHPMSAHWGVEDPAAVQGTHEAISAAFSKTYDEMYRRIMAFLALDKALNTEAFHEAMRTIGKMDE